MPTPSGNDAIPVTNTAHRVAIEIDITETVNSLEAEALRLIDQFSRQGLAGDELASAVTEGLRLLSDAPVTRRARAATSEAFNLGRNLEAQRRIVDIEEVVRTEILDDATCEPCRALDGRVFIPNSPEYFEFMPPAKCNGRSFCRGFYLYRTEAEAA